MGSTMKINILIISVVCLSALLDSTSGSGTSLTQCNDNTGRAVVELQAAVNAKLNVSGAVNEVLLRVSAEVDALTRVDINSVGDLKGTLNIYTDLSADVELAGKIFIQAIGNVQVSALLQGIIDVFVKLIGNVNPVITLLAYIVDKINVKVTTEISALLVACFHASLVVMVTICAQINVVVTVEGVAKIILGINLMIEAIAKLMIALVDSAKVDVKASAAVSLILVVLTSIDLQVGALITACTGNIKLTIITQILINIIAFLSGITLQVNGMVKSLTAIGVSLTVNVKAVITDGLTVCIKSMEILKIAVGNVVVIGIGADVVAKTSTAVNSCVTTLTNVRARVGAIVTVGIM